MNWPDIKNIRPSDLVKCRFPDSAIIYGYLIDISITHHRVLHPEDITIEIEIRNIKTGQVEHYEGTELNIKKMTDFEKIKDL